MSKKPEIIRVDCAYTDPCIMDDMLYIVGEGVYVHGYESYQRNTARGRVVYELEHRLGPTMPCEIGYCKKKARWVGYTYVSDKRRWGKKYHEVYALYKCPTHVEQHSRLLLAQGDRIVQAKTPTAEDIARDPENE